MKRIWPVALVLFTIAFVILIQKEPNGKYDQPATNISVVVEESNPEIAAEVMQTVPAAPAALLRENAALEKVQEVFPTLEFDGPAITIEVWDHEQKQPVPYARVLLAAETKGRRRSVANGLRTQLHQQGEVYQCDENGRLRAPRAWLYRWAGAESDQLWGTARLVESEYRETVRIKVATDRNFGDMVKSCVS